MAMRAVLLAWSLSAAWALTARGPAPRRGTACRAKSKGGGKKKQPRGPSGMEWARNFKLAPYESSVLRTLVTLAASSHEQRTGTPLHPALLEGNDLPKAAYAAPIAIIIVTEQPRASPADAPADGAADDGAPEDAEMVTIAEYMNEEAVQALPFVVPGGPIDLVAVLSKPFDAKYTKKVGGVTLCDVTRWAVEKMDIVDGKLGMQKLGAAYAFGKWVDADGMICKPGGFRMEAPPEAPELEAQLEAQKLEVRRLKDTGLTNKDPTVIDAVAELKRLKALIDLADEVRL
ncbi:hypothetical protein M885DRAFT_612016 [Pelagophyceae sp. CCMP2097]|nr:hypothetical protein M885DRAFT_612016 [Pelagophyceae sp. CCMP2097]